MRLQRKATGRNAPRPKVAASPTRNADSTQRQAGLRTRERTDHPVRPLTVAGAVSALRPAPATRTDFPFHPGRLREASPGHLTPMAQSVVSPSVLSTKPRGEQQGGLVRRRAVPGTRQSAPVERPRWETGSRRAPRACRHRTMCGCVRACSGFSGPRRTAEAGTVHMETEEVMPGIDLPRLAVVQWSGRALRSRDRRRTALRTAPPPTPRPFRPGAAGGDGGSVRAPRPLRFASRDVTTHPRRLPVAAKPLDSRSSRE